MCRQPIAHGESTDLLVLDSEGLYKPTNANTSYDKEIFTLFKMIPLFLFLYILFAYLFLFLIHIKI